MSQRRIAKQRTRSNVQWMPWLPHNSVAAVGSTQSAAMSAAAASVKPDPRVSAHARAAVAALASADVRAADNALFLVSGDIRGSDDALSASAQVFMLAADTVLDGESLARILRMGHSRVPVHRPGDRTDLLGVVLVKELVLLDPDDRVRHIIFQVNVSHSASSMSTCRLQSLAWCPLLCKHVSMLLSVDSQPVAARQHPPAGSTTRPAARAGPPGQHAHPAGAVPGLRHADVRPAAPVPGQ